MSVLSAVKHRCGVSCKLKQSSHSWHYSHVLSATHLFSRTVKRTNSYVVTSTLTRQSRQRVAKAAASDPHQPGEKHKYLICCTAVCSPACWSQYITAESCFRFVVKHIEGFSHAIWSPCRLCSCGITRVFVQNQHWSWCHLLALARKLANALKTSQENQLE